MSKHHRPLVAAVVLVASLASEPANAQAKQWEVVGPGWTDCLGRSLTFTPDMDGDGLPDFLVGAPNNYLRNSRPGRALLYSGATNGLIREFDGDTPFDGFGAIVANLGDVDGDGVPDFAFAAPHRDWDVAGVPQGAVFVYSGAGNLIRSYTSIAQDGKVGEAMTTLGDIDGDGANDLVYSDLNAGARTIFVVSGATGATIWSVRDTTFDFGFAVGRTGDTDADGVEDFAVCDAAYGGHVHVYSGSTGSKLFTFAADVAIVRPAGDVDLDGHADLILCKLGSGKVPVVSGATGTALYTFTGNYFLGYDVSATGDFDGDGHNDLVVVLGKTRANPDSLFLHSGVNGALLQRFDLGGITKIDATADFDGDGVADFLGGSGNGGLFIDGPAGFVTNRAIVGRVRSSDSALPERGRSHGGRRDAERSAHHVGRPPGFQGRAAAVRGHVHDRAGGIVVAVARAPLPRVPADAERLLDVLRAHRDAHLIVIGMGVEGLLSRVFFPLFGSLLTWGFLNKVGAPGQLPVAELVDELCRYAPDFARRHGRL
jgi:hypothetical protein